MKTSIKITTKKKAFSLPKTQPTKSSSSQILHNSNINDYYQIQTCPQVSCFNVNDDMLYTHKINIDYGRLQYPNQWPKQKIKIEQDSVNINQQFNQTQRHAKVTNNSFYISETEHKPKILIKLAQSVQLCNKTDEGINTLKKSVYLKQQRSQIKNSNTKLNPESSNKKTIINLTNQHYPKLKQVYAAKRIQQLGETINKNIISQQPTFRNQLHNSNNSKQKTHRPIPHCRIIRSYVGGNKMQIKIISYPDNSQYMKLCGFKK